MDSKRCVAAGHNNGEHLYGSWILLRVSLSKKDLYVPVHETIEYLGPINYAH